MWYYNILICGIISSICLSCKPVALIQGSYEKESIIIPHFFLHSRGTRIMSVSIYDEFVDSVFTQFSNKLFEKNFDLDIVISDTLTYKFSDSLWKRKKRKIFYNHNKIDESYVTKSAPNDEQLYLIPYIHYSDNRIYSGGTGTSYYVHIGVSFYMVKNNSIIYSVGTQRGTKKIFYVTKDEIDWETLNLYVDELWGRLIYEGLNPYIERLK